MICSKKMLNKIPKLSIIIISYNTRGMTLGCIHSVFSETKNVSFEVIVLDNASIDGSYEAIAKEFSDKIKNQKIKLISSPFNLGFAVGNNLAVDDAKGEYLLFLNPDTLIMNRAIDKMISFAEKNQEAGIWGGRTQFADYSLNPASCWSRQTLWSLLCQALGFSSMFRRSTFFNPEGIGGWDREGQREVDIVSGCFFLIRCELWNKLSGFHTDFFMYGEEADLCLRARSFGARPIVTSKSTIIHYGGASESVRADKLIRLLKAKRMLIHRHFHSVVVRTGVYLLTAWPLSRWIAHNILAALGRSDSKESAKVWGETWHRRNEWLSS